MDVIPPIPMLGRSWL